jgi:hypothetical protein
MGRATAKPILIPSHGVMGFTPFNPSYKFGFSCDLPRLRKLVILARQRLEIRGIMKIEKGGTDMWCPNCKEIATCQAIPAAKVTDDKNDYAQRWYKIKHPDVNWFQRGRRCLSCNHKFVTAEADIGFLDELLL